ncbi:MAG: DNA recombination protein RmuC [Bacteroidales bacterium]|nr:DNA recombination protein RmuC [Bacteroidales bacterium]
MTEILLGILILLAIVNVVIVLRNRKSVDTGPQLKEVESSILRFETVLEKNERTLKDEFERNRRENQETAKANREELTRSLQSFEVKFATNIKELNELIRQKFGDFNKQQIDNNRLATDHMKGIQETIEKQLLSIRDDNTKQLNEMRKTVDEKLQTTLEKRLGESFKQVSERLEQVHKGLGEMQTIASGVGDLKKVLSNVKTRGVLGEYLLGNILEQILTPDQYSMNVSTKKGSQAHVEYAIKLPGKSTDEEVWMPVDSKFPIESYELLLVAYDQGNPEQIEAAQKILIKSVEGFAKDISEKYLDPPHTTDFGIMFLPVESLYAEVLRHPGLFETLQRTHRITVTGPTTLSALLNSLQMGFRTLAVQKRSSEVWKVLGAVKAEFETFSDHLKKVRKQLDTATGTLDKLQTTRTNQIERKLRTVETLDAPESKEILELPSESEEDIPEVE